MSACSPLVEQPAKYENLGAGFVVRLDQHLPRYRHFVGRTISPVGPSFRDGRQRRWRRSRPGDCIPISVLATAIATPDSACERNPARPPAKPPLPVPSKREFQPVSGIHTSMRWRNRSRRKVAADPAKAGRLVIGARRWEGWKVRREPLAVVIVVWGNFKRRRLSQLAAKLDVSDIVVVLREKGFSC